MTTGLKLSYSKQKLYARQETVIREYLQIKRSGQNLTEWKYRIAKKLKVTPHTIDSYIRKKTQEKILKRIIENSNIAPYGNQKI